MSQASSDYTSAFGFNHSSVDKLENSSLGVGHGHDTADKVTVGLSGIALSKDTKETQSSSHCPESASISTRFKELPQLGHALQARPEGVPALLMAAPIRVAQGSTLQYSTTPRISARGGNKGPSVPPARGLRKAGKGGKASMPVGLTLYMQTQSQCVPQAALTQQLWGRSLWSVLKGGRPQQRVWAFGGNGLGPDDGVGRHTSQHPLSIIEGDLITSVAAGGGYILHGSWTLTTLSLRSCLASMHEAIT